MEHVTDVINNILKELSEEINNAKKLEQECSNKGYWDGVIANQSAIRGLESAEKIVKKYKK